MHPSLLLGLLATLLPSTASAQNEYEGDPRASPGFTANFTSPTAANKTIDFYDPPTISWELPSDPSAPEHDYPILTLYIVRNGPPTNTYHWPIADFDPAVDTNFTWTESRADWAKVSQGKDDEPSKWWFEAGLKHSKNETIGMYFRSSVFQAAFNGTGGDDESGAAGVRASFGGALIALAAAALVL
jgi:hypothetical protein